MTKPEAEAFGIPPDQAFRYARITDAKANLAPKERASWIELVSVDLGNCDVHPAYPSGDSVQAARVWQPPLAFDGLDVAAMERIFPRLREGPGGGWFYSKKANATYWAGQVIIEEADKSATQAAAVLAIWLKNGVLTEQDYRTPKSRNAATRVMPDEVKVAAMLAPMRTFEGDEE